MSIKEIQDRHDAFKPWKIMFMRDYRIHLKPAHKDRGELLDALKEIGELEAVDGIYTTFPVGTKAVSYDELQAILDKL